MKYYNYLKEDKMNSLLKLWSQPTWIKWLIYLANNLYFIFN